MLYKISKNSTVQNKSSNYQGDLSQPIPSKDAEAGESMFLTSKVKETEEIEENYYENTAFISMCFVIH
jgi:hypothetical protein